MLTTFGVRQAPEDFGAIGYSDLLYSVTDNGFLWRNGELVQVGRP